MYHVFFFLQLDKRWLYSMIRIYIRNQCSCNWIDTHTEHTPDERTHSFMLCPNCRAVASSLTSPTPLPAATLQNRLEEADASSNGCSGDSSSGYCGSNDESESQLDSDAESVNGDELLKMSTFDALAVLDHMVI